MGILETINDLVSGKKYDHLSQEQTEAFIDTLIYTIVADDQVDPSEERRLAKELEEFEWDSGQRLENYTQEKLEEIREIVRNESGVADFCEELGERLGDQSLREEAYYFAARFTFADSDLRDEERVALNHLVEAFDIDPERLELMTQELVREFGH